jgi:hypothetical protein
LDFKLSLWCLHRVALSGICHRAVRISLTFRTNLLEGRGAGNHWKQPEARTSFPVENKHVSLEVSMAICFPLIILNINYIIIIIIIIKNGTLQRSWYWQKTNSVASVSERTIPTERPPFVPEISASFCG